MDSVESCFKSKTRVCVRVYYKKKHREKSAETSVYVGVYVVNKRGGEIWPSFICWKKHVFEEQKNWKTPKSDINATVGQKWNHFLWSNACTVVLQCVSLCTGREQGGRLANCVFFVPVTDQASTTSQSPPRGLWKIREKLAQKNIGPSGAIRSVSSILSLINPRLRTPDPVLKQHFLSRVLEKNWLFFLQRFLKKNRIKKGGENSSPHTAWAF